MPFAVSLVSTLSIGVGSTACSNFRDLFSAHADVAADAGGQELPAERLAEIVVSPKKGVRINRETVEFVANAWIDYTLFGQAAARGQLPLDSASITEVLWPEISEIKGNHWHDSLMARRGTVQPAAVDSVYGKTDVRVLQHILFSVKPNTDSTIRKATYQKAETALKQIRSGTNFGTLAIRLSDDAGSKADSGYLPPSPKGRFVVSFDSAGWALQPGQVSGVVRTDFGYHIIKRPPLADVRDRVTRYLSGQAGARLDSIYMDSLAIQNKVELASGATAAMRAAASSPDDARNSTKALVHYKGGALTLKDFVRWMRALPPQYSEQLKTADDMMLTRFARILTQNVLLLRQADSAKVGLTSEEWSDITSAYRANLDTLRGEMDLQTAGDTSVAVADRIKVADLKVERYFDQLISGQRRLRPLPSALATLLRQRFPNELHEAGVSRATEIALEKKAKADSTAPQGPMQRAPGGPPIPLPNGAGRTPGSAAPAPPGTTAPAPGTAAPTPGTAAPTPAPKKEGK
jgi:hypothetical protein